MTSSGLSFQEYEGDPITEIDEEAKALTLTFTPQLYRPLDVFKALTKIALTLMEPTGLARVPEALRWLATADLTTNQIDDGA